MDPSFKAITSFVLTASLFLTTTGCFRTVPKYEAEPIYEFKKEQQKVPRMVAVALFTNLSKQPGVEIELADKLYYALGQKGFIAYTPMILKMPKQEAHDGNKVAIVSEYYNYPESLNTILAKNPHWVIAGYIQDGSAANTYSVTLSTFKRSSDTYQLEHRMAIAGNVNDVVVKAAERLIEADKKSPVTEEVTTDERVQVGSRKIRKGEMAELDLLNTLLVAGAVVAGVIIVVLIAPKK